MNQRNQRYVNRNQDLKSQIKRLSKRANQSQKFDKLNHRIIRAAKRNMIHQMNKLKRKMTETNPVNLVPNKTCWWKMRIPIWVKVPLEIAR